MTVYDRRQCSSSSSFCRPRYAYARHSIHRGVQFQVNVCSLITGQLWYRVTPCSVVFSASFVHTSRARCVLVPHSKLYRRSRPYGASSPRDVSQSLPPPVLPPVAAFLAM